MWIIQVYLQAACLERIVTVVGDCWLEQWQVRQ